MQAERRISSLLEYYSEAQPILFKDSANERRISSLLEYYSEAQPILFKDSANERNVSLLTIAMRVQPILLK